jgi:hypothetical protein
LERGDATNTELNKLSTATTGSAQQQPPPSSFQMPITEEILYNHSLAFGRKEAAKHLLGQHESTRLYYWSAGLLTETLLLVPRVQGGGTQDARNVREWVSSADLRDRRHVDSKEYE